jgi:hypothetical protein
LEDLSALVEGSPAPLCESQALIHGPELVANVVEINFLDNLQTELRLTFLALSLDACEYNVSNHKLETQLLSGKVQPHLHEAESERLRQSIR